MAKTLNPRNNLKNFRRQRAAARLEAYLKLSDKELIATSKRFRTSDGIPRLGTHTNMAAAVKAYREERQQELTVLKSRIVA